MNLVKTSATVILSASLFFIISCGDDNAKPNPRTDQSPAGAPAQSDAETHGKEIKPVDVTLTTPLNIEWVNAGKGIYDMKCQGCHKLDEERLVGPGWANVTKRREPHWVMNMITNVDMMLESDPEAQKLLEQCLVRMPNQNISKDDARKILEFMRQNDGVK
jgi:hypothetical protein